MHLGIWDRPRSRSLPFAHEAHEARDCENCHVERPTLRPDVDCASCHEDHHTPEARCMTCHEQPAEDAHDIEAHLGCGGTGCHSQPGFDALVQERATCLVCHQAQEDHEPGQDCAECHQIGEPAPLSESPYLHVPAGARPGGGR